ncbi:MAG: SBBP repeat-containing protein, partial [Candidatus Hydrogenedentes bacterium]|nr:SBBP repeat-containing protein [Candidatus Hydrogenedentota bacterium]
MMRDATERNPTCSGGWPAFPVVVGRAMVAILLLPCTLARAADGDFVRAGALGGGMNDYARAVAVDDSDNVYVTGEFSSTADFDPGAATYGLTSQGSTDIYACKLDSDGALVWAVAVGGTLADVGNAIAVDGSGNVFVTGYFTGTVDFDPGAGTYSLTSSSNSIDIFVLKLDSSGAFIWACGLGCPDVAGNHDDRGHAIAADASGNVYVTGRYHNTVDFDPGAGTQNLTSNGNNDIFVCKLDADGALVWAKGMGGASEEYGYGIAVDSAGNVFITGTFGAAADFDPGSGTFDLIAQNFDGYVCRLDAAGDFVWAGQLGGPGFDGGMDIALDTDGNVYSIGNFVDTADLDPGAGTYNLTSSYAATYVSKLDGSGAFVWAKGFVGDPVTGTGIAV